jgi:AcrR family transcriptional regulator
MHAEDDDSRGDRSSRAEAQRERRRVHILLAAAKLFGQRGYHGTSVADVIEAAEISRGTFYLYFDSKDAVFLELMEQFIQRIMAVVQVVDPEGPTPTERIAENVRRVVDVVFEHRDLTVMVLREGFGVRPEVDEKLGRFYGFVREMLEGALRNGARHGLTRQVDEALAATALIGAIKEVFLNELVLGHSHEDGRKAISEALVDFGLRGLLIQR